MVAPVFPTTQNQADKLTSRVIQLFDTHHKYTDERLQWVCSWIGIQDYKQGEIRFTIVEARFQFLSSIWDNFAIFRPFDTISEAERVLEYNPTQGFILRLSTSQAGKITLTRRANEDQILHSRFTVLENLQISDSKGNLYNNLQDLCEKVCSFLRKETPFYLPVQYFPTNPFEL